MFDHTDEPPLLIRAASLGTPNKRVGEATLDLLDSIQQRGYDITRLTFDRGYNHVMSGGFHKGLLDRGIPNVQGYREEQKGITNGVGGTKFVEGDYYCPGTAPEHLDATVRYDEAKGDISENAWRADLAERWKFALHLKDVKPNGKVRLSCPALGPSATVVCPVRKSHPKAFRGKTEPGQVLDANVPKRWKDTALCCQDSVTINPNEFLKETQMLRYGSDEWLAVYRTDRNTIESVSDKLKADSTSTSAATDACEVSQRTSTCSRSRSQLSTTSASPTTPATSSGRQPAPNGGPSSPPSAPT